MLCSKLHFIRVFKLKHFPYEIEALPGGGLRYLSGLVDAGEEACGDAGCEKCGLRILTTAGCAF